MKYIKQLCIILAVSLLGEALHALIPLPIPASIYGMLLMLVALLTKVIKLEQVEKTADFLVAIMPLMFIPPAVGLVELSHDILPFLLPALLAVFLLTPLTMGASGSVTQALMKKARKPHE